MRRKATLRNRSSTIERATSKPLCQQKHGRIRRLPVQTSTDETLHRRLSFWNNLTLGFAMVAPVVGL